MKPIQILVCKMMLSMSLCSTLLIFHLTFSRVCVLFCVLMNSQKTFKVPFLCLVTDISWKSSVSMLLFFNNNSGSNECVILTGLFEGTPLSSVGRLD